MVSENFAKLLCKHRYNDDVIELMVNHLRITLGNDDFNRLAELMMADPNELKGLINRPDIVNEQVINVLQKTNSSKTIISINFIENVDDITRTFRVCYLYKEVRYYKTEDCTGDYSYRSHDDYVYKKESDKVYETYDEISYLDYSKGV